MAALRVPRSATLPAWQSRSPAAATRYADAALTRQVRERLSLSPFYRERVAGIRRVGDLAGVATSGEHDLCPDRDPGGAARLVVQADEAAWAATAAGPDLRAALRSRMVSAAAYRRRVRAALATVQLTCGGLTLALPIASTRRDLDVIARAGARTFRVAGLAPGSACVSAVPPSDRLEHLGLVWGALGAGCPLATPGPDPERLAQALAAMPVRALALRLADLDLLDRLVLPDSLDTLLVVGLGEPSGAPAAAVGARARRRAGAPRVVALWGPPDARWLWAADADGFVTYPDLEILATVDGELVVTQLELAGSALLRWRTGARAELGGDPAAPRLAWVAPEDLAPTVVTATGLRAVDLRAVAAALGQVSGVAGWQLTRRPGRGGEHLVVTYSPGRGAAGAEVGAALAAAVAAAAGTAPTQVVCTPGLRGPGVIAGERRG